jgi:carbamoyl-phosphate synthase large subunit
MDTMRRLGSTPGEVDPMAIRVLVTGAGGAAAVSVLRALSGEDVVLFAADVDPHAVGLYLVPEERRLLVPRGDDDRFPAAVLEACRARGIDVLVPTVDAELMPLARARPELAAAGVRTVLASSDTLSWCLDKLALVRRCEPVVPVPRSAALDADFEPESWPFPVIVKPRTGSGGRGVTLVRSPDGLASLERDGTLLVQEYLPGEEYSVDVFADQGGTVRAAVPRVRLKVDSGVAVTARTVRDPDLERLSCAVAERIRLTYVANVQFRRDAAGVPRLLEVNPRFPGTMPLTIRAGVHMPRLALWSALGLESWPERVPFSEIAVVRHWHEVFIDPDELEGTTASGAAWSSPAASVPFSAPRLQPGTKDPTPANL